MSESVMALSVRQPWASLIASGAKRFETRSVPTYHRGLMVIQASKYWKLDNAARVWRDPYRSLLEAGGVEYSEPPGSYPLGEFQPILPLGAAVAVVEIGGCHPTSHPPDGVGPVELALGDWGPGRWAWELKRVWKLPEPIPMPGRQGVWTPSDEDLAAILAGREWEGPTFDPDR